MDDDVRDYVTSNTNAVAFLGYDYLDSNRAVLVSAAIQNDMGLFVEPAVETLSDGSYNPLSRRLSMNVARGPSLQRSRAFLNMGLSLRGDRMTLAVGYVPLPVEERNEMRERYAPALCFSAENVVHVLGKGLVPMSALRIGDKVLAGDKYETVYSFGHRHTELYSEILQIIADNAVAAELSENHMLFVGGKALPASAIKVGDKLDLANGSSVAVTKINTVGRTGVFAPFTESGLINVNGVVASTYVNLQGQSDSFMVGPFKTLSMQFVAHATQAPHRVVCTLHLDACKSETYNEEGISRFVAAQLAAAKWLFSQKDYVVAIAFGPILVLVGVASLLECLVKYPIVVIVMVVAIALSTIRKKAVA